MSILTKLVGACAILSTKLRVDTKPGELSVGGILTAAFLPGVC